MMRRSIKICSTRSRRPFNGAFVAPDGRIKGNTQACYVMAIVFGLVDGENAKRAAQYLVEDIEKKR